MGYSTDYNLTIKDPRTNEVLPPGFAVSVIAALRDSNCEAQYALNEYGKCSGNDSRWYNHFQDLKDFSKKYTSFLFELTGEGEESGDIWREYFVNGKAQVCKAVLTFPEFNLDALG